MKKIPFSKVTCDGNELAYVEQVLKSGWLTTAGRALEFENKFKALVKAPFACAVNSCTAALHLALEAIGVGPGDKVIVPTWTFTATAEVVRYMGADPVFVDVDEKTCLLTPEILARAFELNPKVKAVIVVHFAGQAANLTTADGRGLLDECRKRKVWLIEDAAHSFPTLHRGEPIGSYGDIACFSFYANKTITTGEGGMLTTHHEDIFKRCKVMRLHGINRDIWDRFTSDKPSWEYDVVAPGFKYNMPDINAAIGLAQLERAEQMRIDRQRCCEFYLEHLKDVSCLSLPGIEVPFAEHAWHLFPVVLNEKSPVPRNELIEALAARGIGTSVHYKPLHRMTYYREKYSLQPQDFPNAERVWKGCFSLPVYPELTSAELGYIVDNLRDLLKA